MHRALTRSFSTTLPTDAYGAVTFDAVWATPPSAARPRFHFNWDNGTGNALSANVYHIASYLFEDVTSSTAAAGSASAAASSASSAAASQSSAGVYASSAQNSATAAANSATVAGGNASAAAGSASSASTSATNAALLDAANSASAAATSASSATSSQSAASSSASAAQLAGVSATATAASLLPSDFSQGGTYWTEGFNLFTVGGGTPDSYVSYPVIGGVGPVLQTANAGVVPLFSAIGHVQVQPGHSYQVSRLAQVTVAATNTSAQYRLWTGFASFDASGSYLGVAWAANPYCAAGAGWILAQGTFTTEAIQGNCSGTVFIRPVFHHNWIDDAAVSYAGNGTMQTQYCRLDDVTSQAAAAGSATAAANSASSAAASQSGAGSSASSAQTSATNAATSEGNASGSAGSASNSAGQASGSAGSASASAGQASGYAGSASTSASAASISASNASGSANTAATQATNASNSASNAAGSASAASGSASAASTSAGTAGTYATSAQSSANSAAVNAGSAATSASSASSSSAAATSAAAAAQDSATLSASVSLNSINRNPSFSAWSNPSGLPDGYGFWSNSDNTAQIAGLNGNPYAVQQAPAAGEQIGFYQDGLRKTRGWYVIEVDCRISGSFVGAGVGFYGSSEGLNLQLHLDPDVNGVIRTASEADFWTYRWRKLVEAAAEDYTTVLYTFTAYAGLGDVSATRVIQWDHVAIRPATDGEIKGQRADTNATAALAQISSNQAAQASINSAQASTNSTISAQIGDASSTASRADTNAAAALAQISSNQAAQASLNSTQASTNSIVSAQIGSASSTASAAYSAAVGAQGTLSSARITFVAAAGDGRAQFTLSSDGHDGRWALVGDGQIDGSLNVTGSITSGPLAPGAASASYWEEQASSNGSPHGAQVSIYVAAGDIPSGQSTVGVRIVGSQDTLSTTYFDMGYLNGATDFGSSATTQSVYNPHTGEMQDSTVGGWTTTGNLLAAQPPTGGVWSYTTFIQLGAGYYTFAMYNHGDGNGGGSNIRHQSISVDVLKR